MADSSAAAVDRDPWARADVQAELSRKYGDGWLILKVVRPPITGSRGATYFVKSPMGAQSIMHVVRMTETLTRTIDVKPTRLLMQQSIEQIELPGSDDGVALVIRERAGSRLSDINKPSAPDWLRRLDTRLSVLRQVLEGLNQLHEQKTFHGDLRFENIAIRDDRRIALMDFGIKTSLDALGDEQRELLVWTGGSEPPTQEGDILAFTKLAQRLLGPRLWDNHSALPDIAELRGDGFEWIREYCSLVPARERPSAKTLLDVLFGEGTITRTRTSAIVTGSTRVLEQRVARLTGDKVRAHSLSTHYADFVRSTLKLYPDTRIALLPPGRLDDILQTMAIDWHQDLREDWLNEFVVPQDQVPALEKGDLPVTIDAVWRDRIARMHFSRSWQEVQSDPPQSGAASFDQHLEAMEAVRSTLIDKNRSFHTQELIDYLSRGDTELTEADIALMRRWNVVLAVPDDGRFLYPTFHFEPKTRVVTPLMQWAAQRLLFENQWSLLDWWSSGRTFLRGKSLASQLHTQKAASHVSRALSATLRTDA